MPNKKISEFTDGGALRPTDIIPVVRSGANYKVALGNYIETLMLSISDETSALTVGTNKLTFRMPYGFTVTGVRASATTAPTGSDIVVDINEGGTSILAIKLTIDAGTKTSVGSVVPAVVSDVSLAADAEITIDIDQVGSTIAGTGLKVYLIGFKND